MRIPEILNLIFLVAGSLLSILSLAMTYLKFKNGQRIKVTRKDTGQSVTVSRQISRKEIHDLAELVK